MACAGLGRGGPAEATHENRLSLVASLLRVEDRRDYDPIVVGRASASRDPWVRSRAALSCGRLRDEEASIYLPVLLRDPDPSVRRAAAFASGISGDRRLLPSLVTSLSDPDAEAAAAAASALGRLGGPEAERALEAVLKGPAGPRADAALALFKSRDEALVPLLGGVVASGDAAARKPAAWALARIPRSGSEDALRGLLDDTDPEVVAWAARGLGLLGDARSESQLLRLATGAAPGPAIQALLALDRLAVRPPAAAGAGGCRGIALSRGRDPTRGGAGRAHGPSPVRRGRAGSGRCWRPKPPRGGGAGASPSPASRRSTPTGPSASPSRPPGGALSIFGSGPPRRGRFSRPTVPEPGSTPSSPTLPHGSGWRPFHASRATGRRPSPRSS
ncbi:MAG: HEAT repeat domain-containing protein [Holophagales bacterium]|nr:HEAT repeat domain-containing protein [Holophagales bacterium]